MGPSDPNKPKMQMKPDRSFSSPYPAERGSFSVQFVERDFPLAPKQSPTPLLVNELVFLSQSVRFAYPFRI